MQELLDKWNIKLNYNILLSMWNVSAHYFYFIKITFLESCIFLKKDVINFIKIQISRYSLYAL